MQTACVTCKVVRMRLAATGMRLAGKSVIQIYDYLARSNPATDFIVGADGGVINSVRVRIYEKEYKIVECK